MTFDKDHLETLLTELQKPMFVYTNNRALLRNGVRHGTSVTMKQQEARQKLVDSRLAEIHRLIMDYAEQQRRAIDEAN